jgi:Kef-type K+ transport system membrane component KefB
VAGLIVLAAALVLCGLQPGVVGKPVEPITRFLVAVATILLVCHIFGALLRRWNQPAVLGEIIGGLLLGPSVLGAIMPGARAWLLPMDVLAAVDKAAQLGLIVFLFLLGCELRLGAIERKRVVGATVLGGMGLPFLAGVVIATLAAPKLVGADAGAANVMFFGLAMAITALPVLARILVDLKIEKSRVGVLSLTSAAIGDGLAWLTLATILTMTGVSDPVKIAGRLGLAIALVVVTLLCVRPALAVLVGKIRSDQALVAAEVIGALSFAALSQQLDLHPMIGAFLFGVAIPRDNPAVARANRQLQGFTLTILLPLFFAGVGLSTSLGLIVGSPGSWLLFGVVLLAAMGTKFVGAGGAARLAGLPTRQALRLGALMNCRGVTELVVASIGLQYGLINELGFTILVLVAVITSAMTGPLLRGILRAEPDEFLSLEVDGSATPAPDAGRPAEVSGAGRPSAG